MEAAMTSTGDKLDTHSTIGEHGPNHLELPATQARPWDSMELFVLCGSAPCEQHWLITQERQCKESRQQRATYCPAKEAVGMSSSEADERTATVNQTDTHTTYIN